MGLLQAKLPCSHETLRQIQGPVSDNRLSHHIEESRTINLTHNRMAMGVKSRARSTYQRQDRWNKCLLVNVRVTVLQRGRGSPYAPQGRDITRHSTETSQIPPTAWREHQCSCTDSLLIWTRYRMTLDSGTTTVYQFRLFHIHYLYKGGLVSRPAFEEFLA